MYCPNCGEADQKKETYCRQCGSYLAEYGKIKRSERPVQENLQVNTFMSILTGLTSFILAIILYVVFIGKADTPVIIYVVAGFLMAMFAWQVQVFLRTRQLKKQFKKHNHSQELEETNNNLESKPTNELLTEADFDKVVPASVIEDTTRNLKAENK